MKNLKTRISEKLCHFRHRIEDRDEVVVIDNAFTHHFKRIYFLNKVLVLDSRHFIVI